MTGEAAKQRPPLSARRRLAGLLAGLLIIASLALGFAEGWDRVRDYDWHVDAGDALAGFAALLAMYAANALGYVLILEQLAQRRLPRRRFTSVWARSLLGRYVPGNVLMVVSRLQLGLESGVSRRVSLAATVYEQALGLSAAAAGGLLLLAFDGAGEVGWAKWLVALVPLGLALLHPRIFGPLSTWILTRVHREPLGALLSFRQLAGLFAWYLGSAALLAGGISLLVHSVVGDDAGSAAYVGLSFLISFVVSMLAFVFPSGLGVREGAFALALARNLPSGVAIAVSAGSRLALTVAELTFVGAAVAADHLGSRAKAKSPK